MARTFSKQRKAKSFGKVFAQFADFMILILY